MAAGLWEVFSPGTGVLGWGGSGGRSRGLGLHLFALVLKYFNDLAASLAVLEAPAEPSPWVGPCLNSASAFPGKASVDCET